MAKVSTNISIDADTKKQAQKMLADMGLDLSTAVNIFLTQVIEESAIPFIIRKVPNKDTIAAIKEAEDFKANPDKYKKYSSFSELLKEVEEDA